MTLRNLALSKDKALKALMLNTVDLLFESCNNFHYIEFLQASLVMT